jgi:hypothetical protein
MFWDRPNLRDQQHREAVLRNLLPLAELCEIRGAKINFDPGWPVDRLEKLLWEMVNGLAKRARLDFADNMPCEQRIMEIRRHLPAMPRKGAGTGWLQDWNQSPLFRK